MATTRGTTTSTTPARRRPSPQDHKPKARVERLRAEARSINDVPEDKLAEASQALAVDVLIVTARGEAIIAVRSPLDWPYETATQLENGDLAAFVHGAVFDDDGQPADGDDPAVPSSQEAFDSLRPTQLDVMRFVDRWREAVDDAVGKLQASTS